nr:MAG TPA: hypothetical protein [Caudoviricetes sp.]
MMQLSGFHAGPNGGLLGFHIPDSVYFTEIAISNSRLFYP